MENNFFQNIAHGIISGIITVNVQRNRDNDLDNICSAEILLIFLLFFHFHRIMLKLNYRKKDLIP